MCLIGAAAADVVTKGLGWGKMMARSLRDTVKVLLSVCVCVCACLFRPTLSSCYLRALRARHRKLNESHLWSLLLLLLPLVHCNRAIRCCCRRGIRAKSARGAAAMEVAGKNVQQSNGAGHQICCRIEFAHSVCFSFLYCSSASTAATAGRPTEPDEEKERQP